jgi:aminoglycoside phosphotransferase (APT) family kinase protein
LVLRSGKDSKVKDIPDLGPVPKRLTVDKETVRRLVIEQFPQWSKLPIAPVQDGGWDNCTFHLGDDMLVRLPSAAEYAPAVEKERRWLPELARQLSLPIPSPIGNGVPGAGYPYSWSIYGWLDGDRATRGRIADPIRFAGELADFLVDLRGIDATNGPQPGIHNWYRGATLRTYDETTRSALADLVGHIDVDLAAEIWAVALKARWDGVDLADRARPAGVR